VPLRDHFHPPWNEANPWEGFHSAWVNTVVRHLNGSLLPPRYRALPQTRLGRPFNLENASPDTFEVRVVEERGQRLVAAIELISPRNKDRREARQAFIRKCATYLEDEISLIVVDVVTTRLANLHQELIGLFTEPESGDFPDLYAVAYKNRKSERWHLELWPAPLAVGAVLSKLPLWLTPDLAVPLDLEASYEETSRVLHIS
jgi:hypothetical protein